METVFPSKKETGYNGLFLVSYRKVNVTETHRIGTVILKRTYAINSANGTLTPLVGEQALPVFLTDRPDNLVEHSRAIFGNGQKPDFWEIDGDRIIQLLEFDKPLGGRSFTFSFKASSNSPSSQVEELYLAAEETNEVICSILPGTLGHERPFIATGTWPLNLESNKMHVVLRRANPSDSGTRPTVTYREIQVEERPYQTKWDYKTTLHDENDLAAFKPHGDLIVLDYTRVSGEYKIQIDGESWMKRNVNANGVREKALFGWESRMSYDRKKFVKVFDDELFEGELEYPLSDPLPCRLTEDDKICFKNAFFNGYSRAHIELAPPPYLRPNSKVDILARGAIAYSFSLPSEDTPTAAYFTNSSEPDEENNWQQHSVAMNLDTLVIEPEKDRCYVVWRGVWPYDAYREDTYRRLTVVE